MIFVVPTLGGDNTNKGSRAGKMEVRVALRMMLVNIYTRKVRVQKTDLFL
jgi:hypothetical protein